MKHRTKSISILVAAVLWILVFKLNWGLALFLAALTPLAFGVARLFRTPAPNRWDTLWLLSGGLLLAYVFSPGPYVGCGQLYYQLTGSPGFWGEAFSYVYSPHITLSVGRFGSDQFNTGLWDYIVQWQILCSRTIVNSCGDEAAIDQLRRFDAISIETYEGGALLQWLAAPLDKKTEIQTGGPQNTEPD